MSRNMTIKYLHFLIEKMKHPETGKIVFELSHWNYSSELPYVAMRVHLGFYETYEQAEQIHYKQTLITRFNQD